MCTCIIHVSFTCLSAVHCRHFPLLSTLANESVWVKNELQQLPKAPLRPKYILKCQRCKSVDSISLANTHLLSNWMQCKTSNSVSNDIVQRHLLPLARAGQSLCICHIFSAKCVCSLTAVTQKSLSAAYLQ